MIPLIKPPPELRGGNHDFYCDRNPESVAHGSAGTGKSLAALFKLVHLAMIYPKTRWFLVRKTKVSLVESALVTLERDVIGEDSPLLLTRPMMRKTRDYYTFPNGSVIVTAGMDKPEKLFSTEYNGGYVQEATELEQDEWQSLKRSLRAPFTSAIKLKDGPAPVPFYQLWGDCNPSYAHHWLKKRMDSGVTSGHISRHEDNPRFYDIARKDWTPDGKLYIEDQLGGLTGFMRDRLLKGIWSLAEGLVYEGWNEKTHVIEPFARKADGTYDVTKPNVDPSWPRYWVIDWGHTDPMVLQIWAKDGDGRIYLTKEWYRTKMLVDDLADWAKNEVMMGREPRPRAIVTDHDPLNEGAFSKRSGFPTVQADKGGLKKTHVQSPIARIKVQPDGRPRMYVVKGYQANPAERSLSQAGKPTSFSEEICGYCWDPDKDTPADGNDHAMDCYSYVSNYIDTKGSGGWGIR